VWWEQLGFGPYYALAIYAFWKGRNWIRIPSIIYGSVMITKISVLIAEALFDKVHKSTDPVAFVAAHLPYILIPGWLILWFWMHEKPFGSQKQKTK
jgi:hypothetical protein